MDYKFKIEFLATGSKLDGKPPKNTIYLDVGSKLDTGIIDHHHLHMNKCRDKFDELCACGILVKHRHLVTENITENIETVTIYVHKQPDFDCFASVYLTKYLIMNGKFPLNYEKLVKYATNIDVGNMSMFEGDYRTPFAIACAISEVAKINSNYSDEVVMNKGLELIDYIFLRLEENELLDIEDKGFILDDNKFNEEIELLHIDIGKYIEDKKKCEKFTIKLESKKESSRLIEVDGIIFLEESSSILHKYWARGDKEASLGKGYTLTIIQSGKFEKKKEKEPLYKYIKEKGLNLTRTIISVPEYEDVCLKKLGAILEILEIEKEREVFENQNQINSWRSRGKRRYDEEWCVNEDPWYDGRGHNYTIVDSPGVNSLLSILEVYSAVKKLTTPIILNRKTRYVFPVFFSTNEYSSIIKQLNADNLFEHTKYLDYNMMDDSKKLRRDFLSSYVSNYIFSDEENNELLCCYEVKKTYYDIHLKMNRKLEIEFENTLLVLQKFGIGFVIFDVVSLKNEIDEICEENRIIAENPSSIRNCIFGKLNGIKIENGVFYQKIQISREKFYNSEENRIMYNILNNTQISKYDNNSNYYLDIVNNSTVEVNAFTKYGMCKNGQVLLEIVENENEKINSSYFTTMFDIYIIAYQKKTIIHKMSDELAKYKKSKKKILRLKENLIEFVALGWFSEITNEQFENRIYKKIDSVFENELLYREFLEQLTLLDEFYDSKFNRKLSLLTSIFFPIITIGSFIDIGFIKIKSMSGELPIITWLVIVILWIVSALLIHKKK